MGKHTAILKLTNSGGSFFTTDLNTNETYTETTFIDSKKNRYNMNYLIDNKPLNLTKGKKYIVTFEVDKYYNYTIKNIKEYKK